jgi:hypothetical protein
LTTTSNDCPECGTRLTGSDCEVCGWRRHGAKSHSADLPNLCDDCRTPTRLVQLTPGDDGGSRCASCHIAYLRHRVERDRPTPEHIAASRSEINAILARADAKWSTRRL